MCHLLNLPTRSQIRDEPEKLEIKAFCQVKTEGKTGGMEALTGVSTALLTI